MNEMEIGSEISNKIRSAIRAKLVDLGSYVDNELPDYIMVMVANKKTKDQMTDDLSLFLGKNTERFTAWLDNLLKKLQSISLESDDAKLESETKPADPPPQPPPEKPKSKESQTQTTPRKSPPPKRRGEQSKKEVSIKTSSEGSKKLSSKVVKGRDDEIQIMTENDDLDDKLQTSHRKSTSHDTRSSKTLEKVPERSTSSRRTSERTSSKLTSERARTHADTRSLGKSSERHQSQTQSSHSSQPQTVTRSLSTKFGRDLVTVKVTASESNETRVVRRVAAKRTNDDQTSRSHPKASLPSDKKSSSSMTSVVGKVDLHPSEDEEDEGYDPLHPSVGKVASIVKISERRSTVPPARQASKSLLMKAVKDAQTSLEEAAKKNPAIPAHKDDEVPIERPTQSYRMLRKRPNRSLQVEVPVQRAPEQTSSLPGLVSRSRREEILREFRERIKEEEEEEDHQEYEEYTPQSMEELHDIRIFQQRDSPTEFQYCVEDDVDQIKEEMTSEEVEKSETAVIDYDVEQTEQTQLLHQRVFEEVVPSLPEPPVRPPYRDEDFEEEEEEVFPEEEIQAGYGEFDPRNDNQDWKEPVERPVSPRFFVTLDGVDPEKLSREAAMEIDEDFPLIITSKQKETKKPSAKPKDFTSYRDTANKYRGPVTKTIDSDSSDGDDIEIENNSSPVKRPKMAERCRFWPSCRSGATCTFHHPTSQCKAFPNCRFGDKCHYIHPNCKFDASCANPSCPYTHASHRNPVAMAASAAAHTAFSLVSPAMYMPAPPPMLPVPPPPRPRAPGPVLDKVTCKFFPLCKNMNCPFNHPKPCRYGVSCTSKTTCRFHHPDLPGREKLKWSSALPAASETKFILSAEDLAS